MQSATNFISGNLNWNNEDNLKLANDDDSCKIFSLNEGKSGYLGMLHASAAGLGSHVFLQDTSSKVLLREGQAVGPPWPNGQVDLTYLSRLPGCPSEPQEENMTQGSIANSSSTLITENVDSLSNTFLQFDLMRNVREQLHLQEEHDSISREGKSRQDDMHLQQQDLFDLKERLRKSKNAIQVPEVCLNSRNIEMEERPDYQDPQDLRLQAVSKELELRWYKHKVSLLRSRVKELLHEKFSMGKQIEKMNQILSKQRFSKTSDQSFPSRTSTAFIPFPSDSNSAPSSLKASVPQLQKLAPARTCDRNLKTSNSRINLESEDIIYQDLYCTASTSSGWQSTQGSWTQQACSNGPRSFLAASATVDFQPSNLKTSVSNSKTSRTSTLLPCTADVKSTNLNLTSDCILSAHDPIYESMGDRSQPIVQPVSSSRPTEQRLPAAFQALQEIQANECSSSEFSGTKISQPNRMSNAKTISVHVNEKSTTSERSKAAFHARCETSSSSSGSNQDSSPGSPSPIRPQRLHWEDAENLSISSPKGISHQGQIKTELCKNWQEYGDCPYSIHCRFAHGIGELRPVVRHPLYKTQICRMLMEGKKCIYDHRCHFRHSLTEEEISLIAILRECST